MAIELKAGAIGQEKGPFNSGQNFSFINNEKGTFIKFGISIGEKDLMKMDTFHFKVNNEDIYMKFSFDEEEGQNQFLLTKPCLHETERYTEINSITFPEGAPASVILEYSIQSIGD